jgi:general secretion pathway protein G
MNKNLFKKNKKGFTLIELLVVIAIIGLLSSMSVYAINVARMKARDARRMADLTSIKKAMELFYDDNNRYPDISNDGVSTSGEVIGDNNGPIEQALKPYLPLTPSDPLFNGSTGHEDYYYAYDPAHNTCSPVVSINRFETQTSVDSFGHRDTSSGGDMNIDTAHYNYCFIE